MSTFTMRRVMTATAAALGLTATLIPAAAASSAAAVSPQDFSARQTSTMKFGYSTPATGGMSTGQAVDHQVSVYGAGVVRRYYNRFPASWRTINSQSNGLPMMISFKMTPASVNSGRYDSALTAWFKAAPRDRKTWWSYMPEPEDDIARGHYSAAAFRNAYSRIAGLSRKAGNSQLISTLTLMAYTAGSCGKGSTRNIANYWPGAQFVDQIAFDCSNRGWAVGQYTAASQMLSGARAAAAKLGKPWGLGEIESRRLSGDDGTRRAAWLKAVASYLMKNGGRFACYFDEKRSVDFRLTDPKSRSAWRSVVVNNNS